MRTAAAVATALVSIGIVGCGDSTGPSRPEPDPAPALVVSPPVPGANGAGSPTLAYVSIRPGTVPAGQAITLRNRRTGGSRTLVLSAGGLDPVTLPAIAGDTIVADITAAGAELMRLTQPVRTTGTLTVIRTEPVGGRTDAPVDGRVVVVFNEPLDPASLPPTTSILRGAGGPIGGTTAVSTDGLSATFSPAAPLEPQTDYTIALGTSVTAWDGSGLPSTVSVSFWTGLGRTEPPVDSFPEVLPPALSYVRTTPHTVPEGARSRFVLREDGTFSVQYLDAGALYDYRGHYSRTGETLALSFDGDVNWHAVGTLRGDSLAVRFNLTMILADFEDGLYRLVTAGPPPPGVATLAFSHQGDIWVINADGGGLRQITGGPGEDTQPAWSPDGSRIAFTRIRHDLGHPNWGEATIQVIKADGTGLVRLSAYGDSVYDAHPTWSPDGSRIAFYSRRAHAANIRVNGPADLWVMGADGTNPTRLTFEESLVLHPAWSPDGSRIAYWAWDDDAHEFGIKLVGPDGGGRTTILTGDYAFAPTWSPDGNRLLTRYVHCTPVTDPDGGEEHCAWDGPYLATVDPDDGHPARLSDYVLGMYDVFATPASWSASGLVAFTQIGCSWPGGDYTCYRQAVIEVLRLSDGQVTRLTEGSAPSWRR